MIVHDKDFICQRCGIHFSLRARYAKYCHPCAKKHTSEVVMQKRAAQNPHVALGVGSGGNQWGRKNHRFMDGQSKYRRNFERTFPLQRSCEICLGTQNLVVHHVDRNRENNRMDNLVMLCRSCHAQVHGLAAHLGETPMIQRLDMQINAEDASGRNFGELKELEGLA